MRRGDYGRLFRASVREWAMQSKRDGLIPIGEALAGMDGPVKAIRDFPSAATNAAW